MELLMHGDPLARTLFGGKSAETTQGTIWLLYLHSPHAALSNGRHRKMRAARTLDMSRRPTKSPPQSAYPPGETARRFAPPLAVTWLHTCTVRRAKACLIRTVS